MSIETHELTDTELQALQRIDTQLQRHFGRVALDERFDARVLARVREWDDALLAAKRAEAEQQYARWTATLARQWQSARHVLAARIAAFATVAIVTGVGLRDALPQGFATLTREYLSGGASSLSFGLMLVAAATVAVGWGISARVKL